MANGIDANLLLVDVPGGRALIDTGSPTSFGTIPAFEIRDLSFPLRPNRLLDGIRAHIAPDLVALIGQDILGTFDLEIAPKPDGRLGVSFLFPDEKPPRAGEPLLVAPIVPILGDIPAIRLPIDGQERVCLLDTGAHIQYVPDDAIIPNPPKTTRSDFLMDFGSFETRIHDLHVTVGKADLICEFGSLPTQPSAMLSMLIGEPWAILGTTFFKCFRILIRRNQVEVRMI